MSAQKGWNPTQAGPWDIPPPMLTATQNTSGKCITNIDGSCIAGGRLVGGASGFTLPGMGNPHTTCSAFPLFASVDVPYTSSSQGYQVATNANELNALIHECGAQNQY